MKSILTIAALAGVAFGARHVAMFLSRKRKGRRMERELAVWAAEGGLVPVARERISAQVSPPRRPGASPRGNA